MTTITLQRKTLDDMAAQLLDLYWQVVDLTGSEPQPVVNNPTLDMAASERERVELERALQQQMTAIQWRAMPSRLLPNHPEYYDDPRDGIVGVSTSVRRFIESTARCCWITGTTG
jgi:hypothetical protein